MKKVDYIIVGHGYAALFFAHQLIKHQKSFKIFSDGPSSASQVSAGVINPAVLKRFTTFWKAQEQIDALKQTLNEIVRYTGQHYLIEKKVKRIFHDEKEKELWLKKSSEDDTLKRFLSTDLQRLEYVKNPFGVGVVNQSARLDVNGFFRDMRRYLEENGHWVSERFNYTDLDAENQRYKDLEFNHVVFAEGIAVAGNPYFKDIAIHPNKGHHLIVKLSQPLPAGDTVKKKHFLFPLKDDLYYYGGTYDRHTETEGLDEKSIDLLKSGLSEFYPYDFEVVEAHYGFRPTVKDRRPILGSHERYKNLFVFNGLGARGILNGCYFSKELFEHIEHQKPLMPEVDLRRFSE